MEINIEVVHHLLPCDQSYDAKTVRDDVWARWDTTMNGFLSHQELEVELRGLLNLDFSDKILQIVKQCSADTKTRQRVGGKLGPNYLQKRQFRLFLQNLHRHMGSLAIFKRVDRNNDDVISEEELEEASYLLIKEGLDQHQRDLARKLSTDRKFTFDAFQKWLNSLDYYSSSMTH